MSYPSTLRSFQILIDHWFAGRYCEHMDIDPQKHWQWISDSDETVRFLYGFFGWRCDIRRGKNGRHCPGIRYKSSLESFWKWWHLVLKQKTVSGLAPETIVKLQDVGNQPGPCHLVLLSLIDYRLLLLWLSRKALKWHDDRRKTCSLRMSLSLHVFS